MNISADGNEIGVKGYNGGVIYFDVPSHLIRWKYYDAYADIHFTPKILKVPN